MHTSPPTTKPPTVPCDPMDATANRDIIDNCSGLMPAVVVGIRHIGVFESALGDISFGICKKRRDFKIRRKELSSEVVHCDTYAIALLVVTAKNSTLV